MLYPPKMRVNDVIEWLSDNQSKYGPSTCKIVGWDDDKVAISSPDGKYFDWHETESLKIIKFIIDAQGVYRWLLY